MRLPKLTLRLSLVLSVGAILLASGVGVTLAGWTTMRAEAQRQSSDQARALMEGYGERIGKEVGQAIKNASVGAATVESLAADPTKVDRDQIGRTMIHLVESNPDIVGMTPVFEPNGLDGRDAAFTTHPYSDAAGRFVPYFFWGPDKTVKTDKLVMTAEAGIDAWYTKPMAENRTLLTAPYLYPINGKQVLMTSVATVLHRAGQPIGVVTTDLSLADLSARANQLRPFGVGQVSVIGGGNLWVANPDAAKLGKAVDDEGLVALVAQAGASGYAEQVIGSKAGKMLRAAAPIALPGTTDRWFVVIEAPQAAVLAGATQARNKMLLTAFTLVALSGLLLWFGSRLIVKPVQVMTRYMGDLAAGDYEKTVPYAERGDEIGEMAQSVEVFRAAVLERRQVRERQEVQQAQAEAERRAHEAERLAEDAARQKVVAALGASLGQLAAGNLSTRIDERFPTEYEALRADFNAAMSDLNTTMRVIVESAGAVRAGAGEITSAADDLSRRTEQQAASLEETAAALDEITATVRQTAQGAEEVRKVVGESRVAAQASSVVVDQAIEAMGRIESSSRQIAQIIGVIDEIAFQTNLLALNAGVEAARAGSAGAGFAVVAQEVRALAQRSADAAKQIKGLIEESTTHVSGGVGLVGRAGKTLQEVSGHVTRIEGLVQTIAASAKEQATGLHEVNTAVNQMDTVTQQNAAMVEETNAASHNLSSEADQLSHLVSRFRTEEEAGAAGRRAA